MPTPIDIIHEYLVSIGFQVDKSTLDKSNKDIKSMESRLKSLFTQFLGTMGKATVAVVTFEAAAIAAFASFTEAVVGADMQVQIFARRMLTTVANARSLKATMEAMGIHNMDELKDVALNPTLRAQFMGLRNLAQGLEPGANIKEGVGNFRMLGYEFQRIRVLFTYFSQYVIGTLGEILKGPLRYIASNMERFVQTFRKNMDVWATKGAHFIEFFLRFGSEIGRIIMDIGKIMVALRLDGWLKILAGILGLSMVYLRRIADKIAPLVENAPGFAKTIGGGAVTGAALGALGTGGIAALGGLFSGGIKGGITGGLRGGMAGGLGGLAIGAGVGTGIAIGKPLAAWAHETQWAKNFRKWFYGDLLHDKQYTGGGADIGDAAMQKLSLAQAALESGNGRSLLARKYHNFFGIKGTGPAGSVQLPTKEFWGGRYHTIKAGFRAYHNQKESIEDHIRFLRENVRYAPVWAAKTFEDKARAIQRSGYATDPHYADKLIQTAKHLNITINVNGAGNPNAVADAVQRKLENSLVIRQQQGVYAS